MTQIGTTMRFKAPLIYLYFFELLGSLTSISSLMTLSHIVFLSCSRCLSTYPVHMSYILSIQQHMKQELLPSGVKSRKAERMQNGL